jgi:hypothetical protein
MKHILLWCTAAGLALAGILPQDYLDHVKYLASPELKGRATGSPELEKAAAYIASQFKADGLKPVSGKTGTKDYEQPFPVVTEAKTGPANHLYILNGRREEFRMGSQYVPFSFSASGSSSGAGIVFAGYGITARDLHYDDYEGLDVQGQFVLILRHEPQENDEKSPFDGKSLTQHANYAIKAANAKAHGARGVILINDLYNHEDQKDELQMFGRTSGPTDSGIFFLQVQAAAAEAWLKAGGHDLKTVMAEIDKDLKPHSFPLSNLKADVEVDIRHETHTVHNVEAFLPGETPEYVILGAHYDHLGMGDEHSLAPSEVGKAIHFGADDNASGTAGVIELARHFAQEYRGKKPRRGILFVTFAGEELGLLGSSYYAEHPMLPLNNAVAMLNMDMIGRIREGKVYVNGSGTGSTFGALLHQVPAPASLKLDFSESIGYGGSDHMSFTPKGVPVMFFFSGLHGDYHKPSDTWDKIDAKDAAALLEYVAALTDRIVNDPERPQFQKPVEKTGPLSGAAGSGYGPQFGSVPDFNEPPKGVRFADVREGTPAAKAGLRAGDILIEFDGREIGNLYDFTYALQSHKAGDNVLVKVLRNGQTIEAQVLLTERR